MKIYSENDASLLPLRDKTVAILGYGNQGRAQALNLRDSDVKVIVGNREDSYFDTAKKDGFETVSISEAASRGDYLFVLTTDESQPLVWEDQIAPGLSRDNTLVWASGYNVGYDLIKPPSEVDVVMVAPRMTGNYVRKLFEAGKGAMALVAVHQDASGKAWDRMMAVAKGIGATRAAVKESSFREEAELDLFTEQVVWSGIVAWFEESFKIGVENGLSPELMVMELYCSGEASEILGEMARKGFYSQMAHHSTTSQYGTLTRAPEMLNDEVRSRMRELFTRDLREGRFVQEWTKEQQTGEKKLKELQKKAMESPMAKAERNILPLLNKAHSI
jgi:ketol-acid reductoisomerase